MKFDSSKQVESRLDIRPNPETFNLALVELESVEIKDYDIAETDEKGKESQSEFKGLTVPRISLTWKNHKLKEDEEDRFFTLSFGVIVSVKNDGTPVEKKDLTSLYETMFANLLHIHNSYKKANNYVAIKSLPDIDETATVKIRAKQFKDFFIAFEKAFNGIDGKTQIFKNKDNSNIVSWLKLLPDYKKGIRYTTPTFVGQGFTEMAFQIDNKWKKPLIEIKPNENIELQAKNTKQKSDVNIATDTGGVDSELAAIIAQQNK
jgi:hypothetical protein